MKSITVAFAVACVAASVVTSVSGGSPEGWDLSGVERIDIDGLSGSVVILPATGRKGSIELSSRVRPDDAFDAEVDRRGDELRVKERWHGSSSGGVTWTIYLPKGDSVPEVRFSTASGDIEAADVTLDVRFRTASGDVELANVELKSKCRFETASGDIDLRDMTVSADSEFGTASGDIRLEEVEIEAGAEFSTASGDVAIDGCDIAEDVSFSSASGDVKVRRTKLDRDNTFSAASGNVDVALDRLPEEDFAVSSASGDVTLRVDDFGDNFTLVLIKRIDRGRISCPFDYTDEDDFREHKQTYVSKTVKRGSGKPMITLRTASGRVAVKD